jgi:leader peptidase (prepilin peptidase)/N-methyltransferase
VSPDLPPAAHALLAAWAALVGAVVGSFLNVVIARVPAGQSVVRPRSRCPRCGAAIAWYDNVPVVSWLLLRARCRGCGLGISARYPLVELLGGAAGLLAFQRHGLSLEALAELVFVALLIALAFIDLDTWLLPNALTWPLLGLGLAASALRLSSAPSLVSSLAGAGIGFAAFYAVAVLGEKLLHKEAMGFGDVWLLAGLGAWSGAGALLPIVLLSSLQGSIVGLLLIALGKSQPGPPVPAETAAQPDEVEPLAHPETPEGSPEGAPAPASDAEADWIPPRHSVPFGPFLVAGALEWLYLSGALARAVPALGLLH